MRNWNLGFLASGGGTNMQAIIDSCKDGLLKEYGIRPALLITNNSGAQAVTRAKKAGFPCVHLSAVTHPDPGAVPGTSLAVSNTSLDAAMLNALRQHDVHLVILAGYMKKVGPLVLAAYPSRILNIHPALLPKFGGQGLYGEHVHAAVLAAGEAETGVTVHLVNSEYDRGPVIAQTRVPVLPGDTVKSLQKRVLAEEHKLYPETIARIVAATAKKTP